MIILILILILKLIHGIQVLSTPHGQIIVSDDVNVTSPSFFVSSNMFVIQDVTFTNGFIIYNGSCATATINYIVFTNVTMKYNIDMGVDFSSILIDMQCDTGASVWVDQNTFIADGSCIGSKCAKSSITVTNIDSSTTGYLNVSVNAYGDTTYGIGVIQTSDTSMYVNGIEFQYTSSSSLSAMETLLGISYGGSYDSSAPVLQRAARNVKSHNQMISGIPYDVTIFGVGGNSFCGGTCKGNDCDACVIDPTRYPNASVSGVCHDKTIFSSWSYLGYLCQHERVVALPIAYIPQVITFNHSLIIEKQEGVSSPGPHDSSAVILPKPKIVHDHTAPQHPLEDETEHSIRLNGDFLEFHSISFLIDGDFVSPFFGAFLFSKTEPSTSVLFYSCDFIGSFTTNSLFNIIVMEDDTDEIGFYNSYFEQIQADYTPGFMKRLYLIGNEFFNPQLGLTDVSVTNTFIIANNTGGPFYPLPSCDGVLCVRDAICSPDPCILEGNNFTGTITEGDAILFAGDLVSIYKLSNIDLFHSGINGNANTDSMIGLDYNNLTGIPCNYSDLFQLKQENPGFFGWPPGVDIRCDVGLPTEKSCSGTCSPPLPPPLFCEVDASYSLLEPGLGHDKFQTLKDAIEECLSEPTQHIYVHDGTYQEDPILFTPADFNTQTRLLIEPWTGGASSIIFVGHSHVFEEFPIYTHVNITGVEFHSQNFSSSPTPFGSPVSSILSGTVMNFLMKDVVIRGSVNPANPLLTPDVNTLMSLETLNALVFDLSNVHLRGSVDAGLVLTDGYALIPTNGTLIVLDAIDGIGNWGSFVTLLGVHRVFINNMECTNLCGGMEGTDAIVKIQFKDDVSTTLKMFLQIINLSLFVNNNTFQNVMNVNGAGYISGLWVENPSSATQSEVDMFWIKNFTSLDYPIGLRYVNIQEQVLYLNEPPLSTPLVYDAKRGMRETARYNTIEGTKYDVKNGVPTLDDILLLDNACNDLCIPPDANTCEVSVDYNALTFGWGTRMFNSIQDAIANCTVATLPMPIQIVLDGGGATVDHEEDVVFNQMKDILLYGKTITSTGERSRLVGRHTVMTGQTGVLIIRSLVLLLDDRVVDRTLPVFVPSSGNGPVDYDFLLENLLFSIGTATTPI
ncbi:MAG: hypothetical protein ACTSUE_18765, partial [Promethearchaeota archaeon]